MRAVERTGDDRTGSSPCSLLSSPSSDAQLQLPRTAELAFGLTSRRPFSLFTSSLPPSHGDNRKRKQQEVHTHRHEEANENVEMSATPGEAEDFASDIAISHDPRGQIEAAETRSCGGGVSSAQRGAPWTRSNFSCTSATSCTLRSAPSALSFSLPLWLSIITPGTTPFSVRCARETQPRLLCVSLSLFLSYRLHPLLSLAHAHAHVHEVHRWVRVSQCTYAWQRREEGR